MLESRGGGGARRELASRRIEGGRDAQVDLLRLEPKDVFWQLRNDPEDFALQAEAIHAHDLPARHGGSLEALAAGLRARTLFVVPERDEAVDPQAARQLASLAGGELVVLDGRCGHQAPSCERDVVAAAVRRFLDVR